MSNVELTEAFLTKIAGWEAVKLARSLLERGHVLSSNWTPPVLKGVVQEGTISYRSGLVLKGTIDLENMCSCRASRQWGQICAHSVAVGLHHLKRDTPQAAAPAAAPAKPAAAVPDRFSRQVAPSPVIKPGKRILRAAEGNSGEMIELSIILPPNFAPALSRGKVMICAEGKWSRGRGPLNAVPLNISFRMSAEDLVLLDKLETLAGGDSPGMLMLGAADFSALLSALVNHPRVTLGKSQSVEIVKEPFRCPVQARLEANGEIKLSMTMPGASTVLVPGETTWVFQGSRFQPLAVPRSCQQVLQGPLVISRSRVPQFLSQEFGALQAGCDLKANFSLESFVLEPQAPRFVLSLAGGLAQLQAQLQCAYGPRIMTLGVTSKEESLWLPDPESPTRYSTRDLHAEQAAVSRLLKSGFTGPDAQGRYQLLGQNGVLSFFAREYPRLQKEWEVTLEERLERSTSQNLERIEPRFQITPSGEQWFDLEVSYTTSEGDRFSAADIQRLILSGQNHTRLKNGRIAVIDTGAVEELQEVLLDCSPEQRDQKFRIRNTQAGFLDSTLRGQSSWQVQAPAQWRERAAQQTGELKLQPPDLGPLNDVLRPYQKHGVAWLGFLRRNQFGGILADEMGLGKTLQALAFLSTVIASRTAEERRPSLVVCPTSLVFNWLSEAKKFVPNMRVLGLHGAQRHSQFGEIENADLVVTSYALIRRDADLYRGLEFDTIVLDEAQHIKNRQTQNAQAVKAIRAENRLVLTGTPLENSVLDLWSIFDFLMPGYLGSAKDFRERYEVPIVREKNKEAQERLARRVKPFLLRRLKREVAQDLPAKIEQVSFCELTEDQRAVYQQVLDASRREVLEAVGAQGMQKSRMVVLNALLRLRQICCDLRLLNIEKVNPDTSSGKLDLFGELLEEIIDGGHRVLVFSQFVSMLSLLKERLASEKIDYCYLDGSTTDRSAVVDKFQKNSGIPVFLISLKAGGVGLNLTGADTVIHFDPWWNPAVEDQATDRAHRIGQTKVVTSYKLIARGTVEEKILNLQTKKRAIIKGLLTGEEEFSESLTWEEIQELLGAS